ncbi:cystathionine beta-lyase (plasmid) [Cereibacter sphaeroides]|uniref:cystathionine beta-lyase n=1 Tax=Cereibacter sphaeroides TaxID=1063 RepID=UPI000F52A725|nr:cystathionine beta-lyase [Cereibacter sphaeroides]AZB57848.1 cystathionine beta-lyase [Cereibacter sphaeroides]AZB62078.1 cystathionine beta-lyase [Cereibacter sphaeroides]
MDDEKLKYDTILTHAGRDPARHLGAVNTPVYRASTILFPTLAALEAKEGTKLRYGRRGTPTTHALEDAVCALEKADRALLAPSGVSAISTILMSFAEPGAHILMTDSAYGPARKFCEFTLRRFGVETTYYDPTVGAGIEALIRPETKLIWMESPGSQTFEVQDVSAIAEVARRHGIVTAIDNTWSGGYFCQPLTQGVDISIQAGTKYISGHSDLLLGTIACRAEHYDRLRETYLRFGVCVGADDAFLALRGLRTMAVRMAHHHESGLEVANWLLQQEEVCRVMHPGLPGDPGHALWQQQFTGASGLFGFVMRPVDRPALGRMFDGLSLFGMGSSWGGFESLLVPSNPSVYRTATTWAPGGQTVRIHVGLEDPADLIAELRAAFDRLRE